MEDQGGSIWTDDCLTPRTPQLQVVTCDSFTTVFNGDGTHLSRHLADGLYDHTAKSTHRKQLREPGALAIHLPLMLMLIVHNPTPRCGINYHKLRTINPGFPDGRFLK